MTVTIEDQGARRALGKRDRAPRTSARAQKQQQPRVAQKRKFVLPIGIALIVIGMLTTYLVVTNQSHAVTVLVTSTDVARGETITEQDLKPLEITPGQGTGAFSADQKSQAVGQLAVVNLPAGTFVTSSNVGKSLPVKDGMSIVGVALTSSQMPSYNVTAGDNVRVVVTPVTQGDPPQEAPQSYRATVFATKWNTKTNQWIVDLLVPNAQATTVAATSATGRVALVIDSGSTSGS